MWLGRKLYRPWIHPASGSSEVYTIDQRLGREALLPSEHTASLLSSTNNLEKAKIRENEGGKGNFALPPVKA